MDRPNDLRTSFCPTAIRSVGLCDGPDRVVSMSVCVSVCLCKTFSHLLDQTSEVHETLPVLFLCQWELVYQLSEKFINFYYPLPITFVVIFSWDLGDDHR